MWMAFVSFSLSMNSSSSLSRCLFFQAGDLLYEPIYNSIVRIRIGQVQDTKIEDKKLERDIACSNKLSQKTRQ